jgi:copper chaperone
MPTAVTRFTVPEISCDHCVASIESALAPLEGVTKVEVDLGDKVVMVAHDPETVDAARITRSVEGQGYDVAGYEKVG